jgi:hypothetical protein
MATAVYSAAGYTLNFGGILVDRGELGSGKFITITQNEPAFKIKKGIGGRTTRSEQKNPSYTVKVNLDQTSKVNDLFSAVHNLDKNTDGGVGILPLYIADRNGNHKFVSAEAFIEGDPEVSVDAEVGDLEWTIIVCSAEQFVGGH